MDFLKTLTIAASGLSSDACLNHAGNVRFNRVIEGLSRQLRAKPERDDARGEFTIDIPVVAPAS